MAQTAEAAAGAAHQAETTFKNYKKEDAARYAAHRQTYPSKLIGLVVNFHLESGGQKGHVVDIGCGPGTATQQIAAHFDHVTGIDASPSMIENARQTTCLSALGEQAVFEVCASEEIDILFEPNSIDLIIVATAAHWFNMPRFYAAASKILKPSGSIAMWCTGHWYADPTSTPNYVAVRKLWDQLEKDIFIPYEVPGNRMCQDLYQDLPLPWTIEGSQQSPGVVSGLSAFDRSTSLRREFNRDGVPDPSPEFADTKGFMKYGKAPLAAMAQLLGTASPITRWRQAHREQLEKGEIEDCVTHMMRVTKEEMAKAGPEGEKRDWIEVGMSQVLIVVKKKA